MTIRHNLEAVDKKICKICRSIFLFEGIVILCLGNLRQNLFVVREANHPQIFIACSRCFQLYSSFQCLQLYENMQLQALSKDPNETKVALDFSDCLFNLGKGKLRSEEGHLVQLFASVKIVSDLTDLKEIFFLNLQSMLKIAQ